MNIQCALRLFLLFLSPILTFAQNLAPFPTRSCEASSEQVKSFIAQLNDPDESRQIAALNDLAQLGADASLALPAVDKIISSSIDGSVVHSAAVNTSKAIRSTQQPTRWDHRMVVKKPAIYLYPPSPKKVIVKLAEGTKVDFVYPPFTKQPKIWRVTAYPDGHVETTDKQSCNYLFWEGTLSEGPKYDSSQGWVIEGNQAQSFFENRLKEIGLNEREIFDFIVYWAPQFSQHKYVYVNFILDEYKNKYPLTIIPPPKSRLQLYMAYEPLDKPRKVYAQTFKTFNRNGFSVVEWGGGIIEGNNHP